MEAADVADEFSSPFGLVPVADVEAEVDAHVNAANVNAAMTDAFLKIMLVVVVGGLV